MVERTIRIDNRQVGHPLLFDQITQAGEQFHQARDDLIEQALQFIAIMGRAGYLRVKDRILGFLKRHAPPSEVSRVRYNIGLVMFCLPILFAWLSGYAALTCPGSYRIRFPTRSSAG